MTFVESRLESLVEENAECADCPWQRICRGYFKWPDSAYACGGVKQLFSAIKEAADEPQMKWDWNSPVEIRFTRKTCFGSLDLWRLRRLGAADDGGRVFSVILLRTSTRTIPNLGIWI